MFKMIFLFIQRTKTYLFLGLVLWGILGSIARYSTKPTEPAKVLPRVAIKSSQAEEIKQWVQVQGHTQGGRTITLRAETQGQVKKILVHRGQIVNNDDVLMTLDMEDREARLTEAKAWVAHHEKQVNAGKRLKAKAFKADNALSQEIAEWETSKSNLLKIEREIAHTFIRASLKGSYEQQFVEIGDFVSIGDKIATLVELNPLLVICYVPEKDIFHILSHQPVDIFLPHLNQTIQGKIRFISKIAEPKTRTFRVEILMENPDNTIPEGISAEIKLNKGHTRAHKISPGFLTLDDRGVQGLKTVEAGKVTFYPVTIINATETGVWVTGPPDVINIITMGADFVLPDQMIEGIQEGTL